MGASSCPQCCSLRAQLMDTLFCLLQAAGHSWLLQGLGLLDHPAWQLVL
jgi:hypothetical protein